jgi:hypothetical protein
MLKKIKQFILVTAASTSLLAAGLVPALATTVSADTNPILQGVCNGTQNANGQTGSSNGVTCGTAGTGNNNDDLKNLASKVVTIFSIIVGIVAVIMIIYGGFRYITSGGDSGKVGGAKNALIYAIIGLVVVVLAQFIVHYVLNTANNATGGAS